MSSYNVFANYRLPEALKGLLGMSLSSLHLEKATMIQKGNLHVTGVGGFAMVLWNNSDNANRRSVFRVSPVGHESIAGNLRGFELDDLDQVNRLDQLGYNFAIMFDSQEGIIKLIRIYGIGEQYKQALHDKSADEIYMWFRERPIDEIVVDVDKTTLDYIVFEFSSGEFIYLVSEGKDFFRIEKSEVPPSVFIKYSDFEAMEIEMKILDVFE